MVENIQNRRDIHTISIPLLGDSPLCPCKGLQALLDSTSGHTNSPLFTIPRAHGLVPLTDSVAGRHLHKVLQVLGLVPHIKFHDFRRSGATWAFHQGVPLHHTMHHGTWQSDSVWTTLDIYTVHSSGYFSCCFCLPTCFTHLGLAVWWTSYPVKPFSRIFYMHIFFNC